MNGNFAGLCAKNITSHTHKVANVKQFLENHVVHILIICGAQVVAADIHLYAPVGILKFHKRGLAHYAAPHYATGHTHLARSIFTVTKIFLYLCRMGINRIQCCRIRVYAHLPHLFQTLTANYFLFAKFELVHCVL
jgi:hypothetical protein